MFFRNENEETFQEKYVSPSEARNLTSESQSSTNAEELQHANCPVCRLGVVERKFTKCGIVLAILLFPLGIVCCFLSSRKKCNRCGYDEGI